MTVMIVVRFEEVNVHHDGAYGLMYMPARGNIEIRRLKIIPAVREAGQFIFNALFPETVPLDFEPPRRYYSLNDRVVHIPGNNHTGQDRDKKTGGIEYPYIKRLNREGKYRINYQRYKIEDQTPRKIYYKKDLGADKKHKNSRAVFMGPLNNAKKHPESDKADIKSQEAGVDEQGIAFFMPEDIKSVKGNKGFYYGRDKVHGIDAYPFFRQGRKETEEPDQYRRHKAHNEQAAGVMLTNILPAAIQSFFGKGTKKRKNRQHQKPSPLLFVIAVRRFVSPAGFRVIFPQTVPGPSLPGRRLLRRLRMFPDAA
jgi:hypothetical protein